MTNEQVTPLTAKDSCGLVTPGGECLLAPEHSGLHSPEVAEYYSDGQLLAAAEERARTAEAQVESKAIAIRWLHEIVDLVAVRGHTETQVNIGLTVERVKGLLQAEAALAEVEWVDAGDTKRCPSCVMSEEGGHYPDCKLQQALDALDRRE